MMPSASRSLTEPIGLKASSLTNTFTSRGASFVKRTSGVFPIVPKTLSNLAVTRGSGYWRLLSIDYVFVDTDQGGKPREAPPAVHKYTFWRLDRLWMFACALR